MMRLLDVESQGVKGQVAYIPDFQEVGSVCHLRCIIPMDQECIGLRLQLFTFQSRHRKGLLSQPDASILFSVFLVSGLAQLWVNIKGSFRQNSSGVFQKVAHDPIQMPAVEYLG